MFIASKTAPIALLALLLTIGSCAPEPDPWEPIFNGTDLSNWRHYLAKPDTTIDVPGLQRDSTGAYLEPLGLMSDPLQVYSVAELDGEPVIRISGQVIGNLFTDREYENYHLRLRFKWGTIKWPWMEGRPRDGGILYHYRRSASGFGIRHELQIHEGDVGSYWAKHTVIEVSSQWTTNLPESIVQARPFLQDLVPTLQDTMLVYDAGAPLHQFPGDNSWQIVIADPLNEKPAGEWNDIEVIAYGNDALHIVNGVVNMVILNAHFDDGGQLKPLTRGSIQLQSEGAELFIKDVYIRELDAIPAEYRGYVSQE